MKFLGDSGVNQLIGGDLLSQGLFLDKRSFAMDLSVYQIIINSRIDCTLGNPIGM